MHVFTLINTIFQELLILSTFESDGNSRTVMKTITNHTNLGELIQTYPKLAQVLIEDYGLHCAGCFAASFDSIEQGAQIHGMTEKQIEKMVLRLNEMVQE